MDIFIYVPVVLILIIFIYSIAYDQGWSARENSLNPHIQQLRRQRDEAGDRIVQLNEALIKERYSPIQSITPKQPVRQFREGDRVQLNDAAARKYIPHRKSKLRTGTVTHAHYALCNTCVVIQRDGKKTPETYLPSELELVDAVQVNIFADWLEENGCPAEWVERLRKSFPME